MNIEEWLTEYAPNVLNIYKQSLIPFSDIKAGTKCMNLKGNSVGRLLEITSDTEEKIYAGRKVLTRNAFYINDKYETEIQESDREGPWYFKIYLLTDGQYEYLTGKLTVRQYRDFMREILGKSPQDYQQFQSIRGWDR